jgi:hypothetical protein
MKETSMNRIEIPLSKTKIALLLAGAIAFVVLGILFIMTPDTFVSPVFGNPMTIRVAGIAAVVFFGSAGAYGVTKLFDKGIGLLIDESGIADNTSAAGIGLIEWTDITEIRTEQVMSTKFLLIFTANPDKYLSRANGFKRKLMKANMNRYGTPLSITSNTLKCRFNDLERLIKDGFVEQSAKGKNR